MCVFGSDSSARGQGQVELIHLNLGPMVMWSQMKEISSAKQGSILYCTVCALNEITLLKTVVPG